LQQRACNLVEVSAISITIFLANKRLSQALGDKSLIIIHFREEEGIIIRIKRLYFPKKVKRKKNPEEGNEENRIRACMKDIIFSRASI
jgi:hypothetical protein